MSRESAAIDYKIAQKAYLEALTALTPIREKVRELRQLVGMQKLTLDLKQLEVRLKRLEYSEYMAHRGVYHRNVAEFQSAKADLTDANTSLQALKEDMQRKGERSLELALVAKRGNVSPTYTEYQDALRTCEEARAAKVKADLEAARCQMNMRKAENFLSEIRSRVLYNEVRGVSHQTRDTREAHYVARQRAFKQKQG